MLNVFVLSFGLLFAGAEPAPLNPYTFPAEYGQTDSICALQKAGTPGAETYDTHGMLPIHYALKFNHVEAAKCFPNQMLMPDKKDGFYPIHYAVLLNRADVVRWLLDHADVRTQLQARDRFGRTAFEYAVAFDQFNAVDAMLAHPENAFISQEMRNRALLNSAENSYFEQLGILLKYGADAATTDPKNGKTALHYTAALADDRLVGLLFDCKCNPNVPDKAGKTPLFYACDPGEQRVVRRLIRAGSDVNFRDHNGSTPLHVAAFFGKNHILDDLIRAGAQINAKDNEGVTPLMIASKRRFDDVAEQFFRAGADLHAQDKRGYNAMMFATEAMAPIVVEKLRELGGNDNQCNNAGENLRAVAQKCKNTMVIRLLDGKSLFDEE